MKITRITQFEPHDETARALWEFLLQKVSTHDEAIRVINRLLGLLEEHSGGLRPTIRHDFRHANKS